MKKLLLFVAACVASASAFSQSFQHGVGLGIYIDKMEDIEDPRANFAFTYNPRINFLETESMSVSVGVPLTIGFSGSYNASYSSTGDNYEENTLGYMINAPLMLNLNLGGGSSKKCEKRFGGFIGGGYGYYLTNKTNSYTYDEYYNETVKEVGGSTMGPAANAGVRFGVGRHRRKSVEVRMSYYRGMTNYKINVFGVNAAFNF
ncbi:Outer membrane protein beta-barrel domain-containing protein [Chitinophaga sp. CF118]|uniref:outer membrane beta-barrel protein n=1 Tax=Chitinophaga sp. CF118 TaxID=1884367 RepID=UPI0008E92000|nr:outer membrane beta-barrel protein [Chitinophaga sp. CF118]SFD53549.1 Outer membrane protein beta-barrel domain-containing protein [Chitinophaga sp. CF118]